jgi:hypothetical protein
MRAAASKRTLPSQRPSMRASAIARPYFTSVLAASVACARG